jgi:predicted pyridoxine 5'-phosphate oxidase superfamily flavin-nucleotide-binding protein
MSIYHEGERTAQRLAGEETIAQRREGMVQPRLSPMFAAFLQEQTLLALATVDREGQPWAALLTGAPGFALASPDGAFVKVEASISAFIADQIVTHPQIGLLAIDPATRLRVRINGSASYALGALRIQVRECFGNCPKYIAARNVESSSDPVRDIDSGSALTSAHLDLLRRTDVFFLATNHAERGPDVSHRGGDPGFIHIAADGALHIPDYPGNSLFNSLGNLILDPRAGIAVPNLSTGEVLQITGTIDINWQDTAANTRTGGTHRTLRFTPHAWHLATGGPRSSSTAEPSPFNPPA